MEDAAEPPERKRTERNDAYKIYEEIIKDNIEYDHLVTYDVMKLNSSHIEFVFTCMKENTTKIRNIKQYLKAVLFNAPNTIDSYYTALVNHDMYGGSRFPDYSYNEGESL